ncbi:MAG: hypothetical protein ACJAUE_003072 [Alcanivorax sp.]|jgi:hypothetical protein
MFCTVGQNLCGFGRYAQGCTGGAPILNRAGRQYVWTSSLAVSVGAGLRGLVSSLNRDSIWRTPDFLLMQRNAWYPSVTFNGAVLTHQGIHSGFLNE